ncbi:MAG: hypothetical protein K2Y37_16285 [Pirellulales bacterium]|nr:hypothetical protein [Pirellulales bacterium]
MDTSLKENDWWRAAARESHDRFGHDATLSTATDSAPRQRRRIIRPAIQAVWQFAGFMVTLPLALLRGRKGDSNEVTVYTAHPSFFLWPLIVMGFVCAEIVEHSPQLAGTLGWVYVWVLVYFLVTMLYDFSTRKLALWALIFTLIWLTSKYVEQVKQVVLLGAVFDYLASLHPKLDAGTVTVLSWLLLLPWLGSLLHMALNGRKRFTPNEIGEFHFGEGSELTDRTGLRFRTKYRDVLETLLTFGGGDLLAVDNHQNVIKRWDNVIGLFFFWNELDRVLHQRAVLDIQDESKEQAKSE